MRWYTGDVTYDTVLLVAFALVLIVALSSVFLAAPYGRFADEKFGFGLSPRLGWFLMELPATVSFLFFFFRGSRSTQLVPLLFLGIWLVHYGNRGFVFPLLIRSPKGAKATFGVLVIGSGWFVTGVHGYLHAVFFTQLGTHFSRAWLSDPRFLCGLVIYYTALAMNIHSDAILRNLRSKEEVASGEKVYRIPHGGLFRWVSCPSYLTELVAWAGFALCTWSLAGVFILTISMANLIPRAFATHRWYHAKFPDYPKERKALIPAIL